MVWLALWCFGSSVVHGTEPYAWSRYRVVLQIVKVVPASRDCYGRRDVSQGLLGSRKE
jgi:hypothetical protein